MSTISPSPGNTRPLNLSNSDAKFIAKFLNYPLLGILPKFTHPNQRGYVHGRNPTDNILELDHEIALSHLTKGDILGIDRVFSPCWNNYYNIPTLHPPEDVAAPCVVLFDFNAAFPSLNHTYLFHVLTRMGFPDFYVNAIRLLYSNLNAEITFNGKRYPGFEFTSGIKQGCPLSGSLFALALDPFLRKLIDRVPPQRITITVFADDIGMHLKYFFNDFPRIIRCFYDFSKVSRLTINFSKTTIIPILDTSFYCYTTFLDIFPWGPIKLSLQLTPNT